MLEPVKRVIDRRDSDDCYYECRRCGTSLDRASTSCGTCGSRDIAAYDL